MEASATAAPLFALAAAKPGRGVCAVAPPPPPPHAPRTRRCSSFLAVRRAHSRAPPPPLPRTDDGTLEATAATAYPRLCLRRLAEEFCALPSDVDRARRLLSLAAGLPRLPEADRGPANRVMGCVARVWVPLRHRRTDAVRHRLRLGSLAWVLCLPRRCDGRRAARGGSHGQPLRPGAARRRIAVAGQHMAQRAHRHAEEGPGGRRGAGGQAPRGPVPVARHWAQRRGPRIGKLRRGPDSAVKMAEAECEYITVLGVDFMSENVRAILDQAGFNKVGVYRMSSEQIGCSLADAASSSEYTHFLREASKSHPSLHVIYINTSLETKAHAHELVPTITCTSSNVVPTILQAFAQIPDINVWYGPDSYMGANIADLFQRMATMSDEEIAAIHPDHNRKSISSLLPRLHYYQLWRK